MTPAPADPGRSRGADPAGSIARARARNDRTMMRTLLAAIGIGLAIDLAILALAATVGGPGAVPGALVGTALALVVTLPTVLTARLTRGLPPAGWATALMGSWMVKMFVLIIALLLLRDAEWIARGWLGVALLAGAVAAAVAEALGMVRSRARLEVADAADEH